MHLQPASILEEIERSDSPHPHLLRLLVRGIHHGTFSIRDLITRLQSNEKQRITLARYLNRVFHRKDLTYILVELGILYRTGFVPEIIRKIKHSLLPVLEDKAGFHYRLLYLFPGKRDDQWLDRMKEEELCELLDLLGIRIDFNASYLKNELIDAIEILSYRITATALESEFFRTFRDNKTLESFVKQNKEVHTLIAQHILGISANPHLVAHINQLLDEALLNIKSLRKMSRHKGASLQLTYALHRLSQQIGRMKLLFGFYISPVVPNDHLVSFIRQIVHNEKNKNRIFRQLNETVYLLAYQVAEHESKTGEHYIASNRKEYAKFFDSSCGGGIIAVMIAYAKLFLHQLSFAPFWQAIAYSFNYAAGFIIIQVTHSTLATKQPAMTASRIAHSLDKQNSSQASIAGLALMIGKVSRSQFISFIGNLLLVFPFTFVIAWVYQWVTGAKMVDESEAREMLIGVHPWQNPTWLYAAITGLFLFISGIISGYYDNKVIYSSIPQRLREHMILRRALPKRSLVRFSKYVENNMGSLIGNIWLGFFLGTAAFFGYIFGLPLDIRHITISAANFTIALFSLIHDITWQYAVICLIGVMGIGFFNFIVSFGLALFVAAKSRRVTTNQFMTLLQWTWVYFKRYPRDFFFPPREERNIEDLNLK